MPLIKCTLFLACFVCSPLSSKCWITNSKKYLIPIHTSSRCSADKYIGLFVTWTVKAITAKGIVCIAYTVRTRMLDIIASFQSGTVILEPAAANGNNRSNMWEREALPAHHGADIDVVDRWWTCKVDAVDENRYTSAVNQNFRDGIVRPSPGNDPLSLYCVDKRKVAEVLWAAHSNSYVSSRTSGSLTLRHVPYSGKYRALFWTS